MTNKLTQAQVDECKILIQRYFKLDNEKELIRHKIDDILDDYKDKIWDQCVEQVSESMTASEDFNTGVYKDEFPYFLENHFDALQEEREESENPVCPRCGSNDTEYVNAVFLVHCKACGFAFPMEEGDKSE